MIGEPGPPESSIQNLLDAFMTDSSVGTTLDSEQQDELARLVSAQFGHKTNMAPTVPSPSIAGPENAAPYISPAISASNLPNGAGSRPTSNGSGPTGPPLHPSTSRNDATPPIQQPPLNYGHVQHPQNSHQPHMPSATKTYPSPGLQVLRSNHVQQRHPSNGSPLTTSSHTPPAQTNGLASPSGSTATQFSQEYLDLVNVIKKAKPDVVRQVIRDHWEKALLGSQYHIAFLLNATMHQANTETLSRAVQDFGGRMIKESKQHVIRHLSAEDFDQVADLLLAKVSNNFLDKAIARRLETIPARELVNALARAERLGYDVQDIVEERGPGAEHVIPSIIPQAYASIPQQPHQAAHEPPRPPPPPATQLPSMQHASMQPPLTQPPAQRLPTMVPPQQSHSITNQPEPPERNSYSIPYCNQCMCPCAGEEALNYHKKKHACGKWMQGDRLGREVCPFCVCRFGSSGGLLYHLKTRVCGNYPEWLLPIMTISIDNYFASRQGAAAGERPHSHPNTAMRQEAIPQGIPKHTPTQQATPQQATPRSGTPGVASASDWVTPGNDPYSKLTPQQRQEFETEMKDVEEHYGQLMRDAMKLPEPAQTARLSALKNRYNTKQSVTRKKYGIRLRERRSKAQIAAERTRLFGTADGPSLSGRDAPKRARNGGGGSATPTAHPSGNQTEVPRERVPVSEMGGLTGSSATAETTDPTASLTSPQPRNVQQPSSTAVPSNGTLGRGAVVTRGTTQDDPMEIDVDTDDDDSESDDDDDIPASLPN